MMSHVVALLLEDWGGRSIAGGRVMGGSRGAVVCLGDVCVPTLPTRVGRGLGVLLRGEIFHVHIHCNVTYNTVKGDNIIKFTLNRGIRDRR